VVLIVYSFGCRIKNNIPFLKSRKGNMPKQHTTIVVNIF
jgi:hypothetical protein